MLEWIIAGSTLLSAGAAVIGAYSSANTAESNAQNAQQFSRANAAALRNYGLQQAALANMTGRYNASIIPLQAKVNATARKQVAANNVEMLRQIANYNSLLYQAELESLYEANELDIFLNDIKTEQAIGAFRAQAGASGAVLDDGSYADVVANMLWEEALTNKINEKNIEYRAAEMLNASAKGTYEAYVEGAKQLWEAEIAGMADMVNASMQANSVLFNSFAQGAMAKVDASFRAQEALQQGALTARNAYNQADYYRTSGWLSAAQSVASGAQAYAGYAAAG